MNRRWMALLCAASVMGTVAAAVPFSCSSVIAHAASYFNDDYTTIRQGDTGVRVQLLQSALTALGYFKGNIDGKFGNMTLESVKAFQKAFSLTADGAAGKITLKKIEERLTAAQAGGGQQGGSQQTGGQSAPPQQGSGAWSMLIDVTVPTAAPTPAPTRPFEAGWVIPAQTLRKGMTGVEVASVQGRLSQLGYYTGQMNSVYDDATIAAVTRFQQRNGLTADGLAGSRTVEILFSNAALAAESGLLSDRPGTPGTQTTAAPQITPAPQTTPYPTLRSGAKGQDVLLLQQTLAALGYAVNITGTYDTATINAVKAFQKQNGLNADGVAGPLTLTKLYSGTAATPTPAPTATVPPTTTTSRVKYGGAPDGSNLYLLHWFNEIKPTIKNGQHILVYDPSTGISWTLRFLSLGRHADSEPLTAADTASMVRAFGGENTWNQKAVYVRLPDGRWTLASTHDMPHLSGSIGDNDFNGHLCVHFLRDMDECKKNDPSYGVSNQNTIRAKWNALTGETIP